MKKVSNLIKHNHIILIKLYKKHKIYKKIHKIMNKIIKVMYNINIIVISKLYKIHLKNQLLMIRFKV